MNKILSILVLLMPYISVAQQEQKKILDYHNCRDAMIFYITDKDAYEVKPNYGEADYISVANWTWHGSYGQQAILIDFNINSIPKNAIVTKAVLTLHKSPDKNLFNNKTPNSLRISQVTGKWKENKVNWENKPEVNTQNSIVINRAEGYKDIDVTELVQKKIEDPENNHGFYIEVNGDDIYQGITFASKEYENPALRPTLTIYYLTPDQSCNLKQYTLLIYNSDMQLIKQKKIYTLQMYFDEVEKLKGDRFLCIVIQNDKVVSSNIIDKEN